MKTTSAKPAKKLNILDLSGIAPASTVSTSSAFPTLNDPAAAKLVDLIVTTAEKIEALEGTLETAKADLVHKAKAFYFHQNSGKAEIPSSITCEGVENKALATFKNQYKACSDTDATEQIAGEHYADLFHQQFVLKIDGDKIPDASKAALIAELTKLFAKHNASEALTAKSEIKPTADFHTRRHTLFTEQQNIALDKFVPIFASIKTKNVR